MKHSHTPTANESVHEKYVLNLVRLNINTLQSSNQTTLKTPNLPRVCLVFTYQLFN